MSTDATWDFDSPDQIDTWLDMFRLVCVYSETEATQELTKEAIGSSE